MAKNINIVEEDREQTLYPTFNVEKAFKVKNKKCGTCYCIKHDKAV